uniref:Uncharacterized protein n=1 Tax=viral metagenome TaxID=1070528 RepID=A0A6M3JIC2_9ZZZZ
MPMKKGTVIRNFDNYLLKQGYRRLDPAWRDRLREAYWAGYELGLSKETAFEPNGEKGD